MQRPNILLFLTDDHGAWALGCNGNREVVSPVLDGLAREGVRFACALTPSPVCSPARACLLTGRTPSQVGIHDWIEEGSANFATLPWLEGETTLPELLAENGYFCGLSGKWHLGHSHQTPRGFRWCFGLPGHQGAHIEEYTYHLNGQPLVLNGNKTGFITDYALEFLDQAPDEQPFFLNVGYISTHSPYANQDPALVALYDDADFADIPEYRPHPWHKNEGLAAGEHPRETLRPRYANYYAAVSDIDRSVGRILDKLRAQNRLENTVVIYTSDHGCALGHHGFWGKGNSTRPLNMYETSLRVPLIWHHPPQLAPRVVQNTVDHYDTFATLCEIAGVALDARRPYPGRSYSPLLRGQNLVWDETRFGEYGDLRMIRTPDWKLVVRYPNGPHELFDLQNDGGETRNLAGQSELRDIETALREQLENWYRGHENPAKSGLRVRELRAHNLAHEAWRDGLREARGLQLTAH